LCLYITESNYSTVVGARAHTHTHKCTHASTHTHTQIYIYGEIMTLKKGHKVFKLQ